MALTQGQLAARAIGGDKSRISDIENGKVARPQPGTIRALADVLDVSEDELTACYGPAKSRYVAYSLATARTVCGSYSELQKAIDAIEDEFPVPMELGEYGDDDKWLELLELCADSGGVVALSDGEIVGYWQCFPISDDTYEAVLRGENVNKSITSADIRKLILSGQYSLFFVSLFVSERHRNLATPRLMLQSFFDFLLEAADEGIFFHRIVANVTGIEARQICRDLHFQKVIDHPVHRFPEHAGKDVPAEIFELVMSRDGPRFFASNQNLGRAYSKAGLF
ncbi:hypothetical protein AL073_07445 [Loktanella sp. 1ANDIMAR09]|nr:hypothetical protein AL073_07445 [Loktanella sp. 1ANDIMAR09]